MTKPKGWKKCLTSEHPLPRRSGRRRSDPLTDSILRLPSPATSYIVVDPGIWNPETIYSRVGRIRRSNPDFADLYCYKCIEGMIVIARDPNRLKPKHGKAKPKHEDD